MITNLLRAEYSISLSIIKPQRISDCTCLRAVHFGRQGLSISALTDKRKAQSAIPNPKSVISHLSSMFMLPALHEVRLHVLFPDLGIGAFAAHPPAIAFITHCLVLFDFFVTCALSALFHRTHVARLLNATAVVAFCGELGFRFSEFCFSINQK